MRKSSVCITISANLDTNLPSTVQVGDLVRLTPVNEGRRYFRVTDIDRVEVETYSGDMAFVYARGYYEEPKP